MRILTCLSLAVALVMPGAALSQTPRDASERLVSFLQTVPDLGPGYAVVAVTPEEVVLTHVQGVRRASTGEPLTPDTPIYIASQTKAYMGLLAAALDERSVLDLDSTIADHWPGLELPGELDPAAITLRDLISHQAPIESSFIVNMEAYVTRLDPADYPRLIEAYSSARKPGFRYSNVGYNLYGAILETGTGRTWQAWLDTVVFDPLGMENTSARTSDFSLDEIAWSHQWQGEEAGWHEVRPKTDEQMQSAGGIVTSPDDMAVWLQLQLRGEGPDGSGITASMVETAHTLTAPTDPEENQSLELPCRGYALGWNICDFEGHTLYTHGGGYTGARTQMAFLPGLDIGVAVFANSDNATGWFTSRTVIQYLQFLIEHADAEAWAELRARVYPERTASLLDARREHVAQSRDALIWRDWPWFWQSWTWSPLRDTLAEYEGVYRSSDGYAPVVVSLKADGLSARRDGVSVELTPARRDLFAARLGPLDAFQPVQFKRRGGQVTALEFAGAAFSADPIFRREE